jgi:hypothetical protein
VSSAVDYRYRVEQEALRRQRELEAARDALRAAERRYEAVRERARAQRQTWGDSIAIPAELESHHALTELTQVNGARSQREQRIAEVERRLNDQVVAARIATFREGIAGANKQATEAISAASVLSAPRPAEAQANDETDETAETLSRVLSKLDADAGDQAVTKIHDAADLVRRSTSAAPREQGIGALRLLVQKANQEAREMRARAHALDELEQRLDGYRGPDAAAARELIVAAREDSAKAPPSLSEVVDSAAAKEERALEAEYVAKELRAALEDLGYEVGPDFETTLNEQGYTRFMRSAWPGYAVQVRTGGKPPRLNFNVVRGDAERSDQAARDQEVEKEFCDRQGEIVDHLARAGIATERIRVVEPGSRSLQVVKELTGVAEAQTSQPATRERNRR